MTATAHALVGGAIAASIKDPVLGLSLAAASHPFLDMIPHWDFGWGWREKPKLRFFVESCFDLGLGLTLTFIFFGSNTPLWYLASCVFLSEVWDILEAPYWFLNWHFPPFSWVYNIQSKLQGKASSVMMGILTQVATVGVIILILQQFRL